MSDNRKRKKAFYKGKYGGKKGRLNNDLRPKLKGFIITCGGQDRSATVEAYRILNEYGDKRYGAEDLGDNLNKSDKEDCDDIEASLKEEITSIKATKDKDRRFQSVQCKPKNVIFIKADIENPTDLALDIMRDLDGDAESTGKIRHCCKLLPVTETCYAKVNQIVESSKPHLKNLFSKDGPPFTYCISWKARCNDSVKRDDVYSELLTYIKEIEGEHKVSYTDADIIINFDVIGNICCLGFIWHYHKYGKYNLNTVSNKNKKTQKEGTDTTDNTKDINSTGTTEKEKETPETCEKDNDTTQQNSSDQEIQQEVEEEVKEDNATSDNIETKDIAIKSET